MKLRPSLPTRATSSSVHDPLAQDAAIAALGDKVVVASSLEGASASATCWSSRPAGPTTRNRPGLVQAQRQRLTVLDLWRTLPTDKFGEVADVLYLGVGR